MKLVTIKIFLLTMFLTAAACASPLRAPAAKDLSNGYSMSKLSTNGGSDGGGGNVLLGKPIDSYVFDFKNSAEYKTYVGPIMQLINKYMPEVTLSLQHTMKNKAWYKVPAKLETLPSVVIGAPFASDQGAIQTLNAVWISGLFYDAKATTVKDKALLLMHEILLGLRYSQLNSAYIFCQTRPEARNADVCRGITGVRLQPQDYDQIRKAAYQLMNAKDQDARGIAEVLYFNGFKIGQVDLAETAESFKDLSFAKLRKLLSVLASQGSVPTKGTIVSNQGPRPLLTNVNLNVAVEEGMSDETFSVTVRARDYRIQYTAKGFNELLYSDTTDTDNSVTYMLQSRPVNAKVGDVVPSMLIKFIGGSLAGISLSEEILMYSPASNKNFWDSVDPSDVTHRPAYLFEIGK